MSWDFAVHGQLVFADEAKLDVWLTLPIEQPEGVEGPLSAPVDRTQSVRAALAAFRSSELHAERKGREIKLRGCVEKSGMLDLGPPLIGALFAGARAGATGGVWLIAVGNTLAYQITSADGAGAIREHDEDMESSGMVAEALAAMARPFANTWLLPPVDESPEDYWFAVGRGESGKRLSEVLAALRFGGKRKLTKGDVQKMLADGALQIDGHAARSHDIVVEGQRVCITGWGRLLGKR